MSKLYFVTSNKGKARSLSNHLKPLNIDVEQIELKDIIEPQADSVEEVSLSKVHQAFKALKKPLIVDDSGFVIEELNGFPGPYIKFLLKTVGAEKLVKVTNHLRSRKAHMENALTYIDKKGNYKIFLNKDEQGRLAKEVDKSENSESWSDLWKIFIPEFSHKTLSAMTFEERQKAIVKQNVRSTYKEFADWISKKL